jgi:hypothetical protein
MEILSALQNYANALSTLQTFTIVLHKNMNKDSDGNSFCDLLFVIGYRLLHICYLLSVICYLFFN